MSHSQPTNLPNCRTACTTSELRAHLAAARAEGKTIGLVPTMGALHAGHLSLVEQSRRSCGFTVVTIFVNPAQFGPGEDFDKYPRTLEADLQRLAGLGVDLVFAPPPAEIYRAGHSTYVEMTGVAEPWEGRFRPGHFRGVATVVLKLFNLVEPDVAFFGQKDYQQSLVIRRLVADLDLNVTIRTCPTVREADGLALSSRNQYLDAQQRRRALVLSRALALARDLFAGAERDAQSIQRQMQAAIAAESGVQLQYAAVVDGETLQEVAVADARTVALIAAKVDAVRLIDNCYLGGGP